MSKREQMREAIKTYVIPYIRQKGFKGSYPHFRRVNKDKLEIISFQFSFFSEKFTISLGKCPADNIKTFLGEEIKPNKVTAFHNIENGNKVRMTPCEGKDHWFVFNPDMKMYEDIGLNIKELNDSIYVGEYDNKYKKIAEDVIDMIENIGFNWFEKIEKESQSKNTDGLTIR